MCGFEDDELVAQADAFVGMLSNFGAIKLLCVTERPPDNRKAVLPVTWIGNES